MRQLTISFIILFPLLLSSQFYNINTFEVEEVPCATDPSVTVFKYTDWELYQTEEDTWNGTRYNGSCPDLQEAQLGSRTNYQIDLSTIDHTKPLFLAYKEKDFINSFNFYANNAFSFEASLYEPSGPSITLGSDCSGNICSGIIIRSVHIDSSISTDSIYCTATFPFLEKAGNSSCWITEKTFENKITDIIYKISLTEPSASTVSPRSISFFEGWDSPNLLSDSVYYIPEIHNNQGTYDISITDLDDSFFATTTLVTHNSQGLPSSSNQSFTQIQPESNTTEAATINLNFNDNVFIHFQKYSHLIGGLVEGSDTTRHTLNVTLGSNQCLFVIELIGTGGTNYKFSGGQFEFNDSDACLQLRDNSSLIVDDKKSVWFGQNGIGNLNLRSGSSIILEEKAEMTFDGKLFLNTYNKYSGSENIHVDLQPSSQLTFTENVKIINDLSDEVQYLYVHMNGGNIDISKLSEEDKKKIILVFPENKSEALTSSIIFPNPCSEQVNIYNTHHKVIEKITLLDINGQTVLTQKLDSNQSKIVLDIPGLNAGMYLMRIENEKNSADEMHKLIIE